MRSQPPLTARPGPQPLALPACADQVNATTLVQTLNRLFKAIDLVCTKNMVEKIKTVGDCYMCAAIPSFTPQRAYPEGAAAIINVGRQMLRVVSRMRIAGTPLQLRVGAHCGTVVMGVIGHTKTCFDLWGDTVNVASRMESTGVAGRIQVSADLQAMLPEDCAWLPREVRVKGKGTLQAYLLRDGDGDGGDDGDDSTVPGASLELGRGPDALERLGEVVETVWAPRSRQDSEDWPPAKGRASPFPSDHPPAEVLEDPDVLTGSPRTLLPCTGF